LVQDDSILKDQDLITGLLEFNCNLGNEKGGCICECLEVLAEVPAANGVEPAGWLIKEQDLGLIKQCHGYAELPLGATTEMFSAHYFEMT
jgi:hypothetical protein